MFIKADLSRVFDGVPVAVHSINPEGVFEYTNTSWLNLFGYPESEVLGKHLTDFIHPDYRTKAENKFREFTEKGELEMLHMKFIRKDGSEIKTSIHSFAVYGSSGTFMRSYAFVEPYNVQPEHTNSCPMPTPADVKNEFVNELLAAISHHWRQPLNALGLNIQNLSESFTSSEHEEMFKEFENISMSIILEMSETIDTFKDFFRVQEDGWFSISKAVGQTLSMYDSLLKESGVAVCVTCNCEEGQTVFTPEHRPVCSGLCKLASGSEINFKQVMMHLLSNAVNAIKRSGQIYGKIHINITNFKSRENNRGRKQRRRYKQGDNGADIRALFHHLGGGTEQGAGALPRQDPCGKIPRRNSEMHCRKEYNDLHSHNKIATPAAV
ncbi:MAG: PAS domain S-box protein [Geovibrio sp.]|nr:PAS domain S-box protein [Geovibrio sp.]